VWFLGTAPAGTAPCGITVPGWGIGNAPGEVLVDVGQQLSMVTGSFAVGQTPAVYSMLLPNQPSLVGATLFTQGMLLGGAGVPFILTDALDHRRGGCGAPVSYAVLVMPDAPDNERRRTAVAPLAPARRRQRFLAMISLSILARTMIDSSLRVIDLLIALRLIPFSASWRSFWISAGVHAWRCRSNRSVMVGRRAGGAVAL
jgi:hypothetical protein